MSAKDNYCTGLWAISMILIDVIGILNELFPNITAASASKSHNGAASKQQKTSLITKNEDFSATLNRCILTAKEINVANLGFQQNLLKEIATAEKVIKRWR